MVGTLKRKFTEQMIENITAPKKGRKEFNDILCPGLILRVSHKGTRTLSVIYKVVGEGGVNGNGKLLTGSQHRITLGKYPIISLADARQKAQQIQIKAANGEDPRKEQREYSLKRSNNTFAAAYNQFMEKHAKKNIKSWKNIECHFRVHILPHWQNIPIQDIKRKDVHELLDNIVATGRVGTAREVRRHLSNFYNWALDRDIVSDSPLHGLKRKDLQPNEDAGRSLTDEEIRAIFHATNKMGYPFGPMYLLLLLTGQRNNEWANARINEINTGDKWLEIPRERYKGNRDHIVPLVEPIWEIVQSLPEWVHENYYLFTTRGGRMPVAGFSKAKARLDSYVLETLCKERNDRQTKLERYRIHDFRVTCETRLANLGFSQEIRDRVLGHAQPGLQKTYNKYDYMDEKTAALAAYANHIMEIVG